MISGPPAPAGTGATYGPPAPADDGSEPADPLAGWKRLARTLDRDVPARLAVTRAAARKIAQGR